MPKKITLQEFKNFTDLFTWYYKEKAKGTEDQWIDKAFKKNPEVKKIMQKFDDNVKAIEKDVDRVAIPFLKKQGIDVSKL